MSRWTSALLALCTAISFAVVVAQDQTDSNASTMTSNDELAVATFAGGCFWCMEPPYDQLAGVKETISGYMGGQVDNPTYEQVSGGKTGHAEVVQVRYDPEQVSYETLLAVFWPNIDPLVENRQFCDVGSQYRSAIFYHNPEQQRLAEASLQRITAQFEQPIATEIQPAATFYPAEGYHQNYYQENPVRYKFYRYSCGRDDRLEELWGEQAGKSLALELASH